MDFQVSTISGESAGAVVLSDAVFGLEPRTDILHRMVCYQLAKRRSGTHKAKNRSEINRSTAKIHKQKGTGHARHSSRKAPIFRGGGKAHGPVVRDHAFSLPKKIRAMALRHALSAKVKAGSLTVIDSAEIEDGKTATLRVFFNKLGWISALVVDGPVLHEGFSRAVRNIPNVDALPIQGINVYDILRRHNLVLTKAAVEALEERYK